jgi:hypothetical protein
VAAEGATVEVRVMLVPVATVVEEAASVVVVAVKEVLHVVPLIANEAGIALVTLFQVPLNPMPV